MVSFLCYKHINGNPWVIPGKAFNLIKSYLKADKTSTKDIQKESNKITEKYCIACHSREGQGL